VLAGRLVSGSVVQSTHSLAFLSVASVFMATTSLASYCPICIFGALSSSILSLSSHVVQTITVDVIPHVTVFANGSAPITTYQSITVTQDVVYPTGPAASRPQTYTNEADITWTVGNATLTYPTTYVQYLRFAGAYATSANGEDCVQQTTATIIQLPSSIDEASLIYPVGNQTAGMPLPSLLLEYLGGLETVSAQFSGEALTGCAPLTATPAISSKVITSSTPAVSSSFTIVKSTKRFEGPRSTGSQRPLVTVTQQNGNGTLHRGQSASGTGSSPSNGMSAMTSEVQESFASTSTSKATTPMGSSMATASHTTAFVISAVSSSSESQNKKNGLTLLLIDHWKSHRHYHRWAECPSCSNLGWPPDDSTDCRLSREPTSNTFTSKS